MRCPFCHNSDLINSGNQESIYSEDEIIDYLIKRKNVLKGIVISGGEPLIQKDIKSFIIKVKKVGYLVKVDTNGTNPELLSELIDEELLDYIAMDIKNVFDKYPQSCGINVNIAKIKKSIEIIKESCVLHEFRTTIAKELHNVEDIKNILSYVDGSKYFLQNFEESSRVLKCGLLHPYTKDELISLKSELSKKFSNFNIRGL